MKHVKDTRENIDNNPCETPEGPEKSMIRKQQILLKHCAINQWRGRFKIGNNVLELLVWKLNAQKNKTRK